MAAAMLAAQVENNIYFYCLFGFRILLGAGFLGVAGLMTKQSDHANNLASLLLVLAMIYNLGYFAINFMTASSVLNVAGIDKSMAEAGLFAAMLFGGVWLLVKIAAYCGLAYYLTRPNIAALFSPTR